MASKLIFFFLCACLSGTSESFGGPVEAALQTENEYRARRILETAIDDSKTKASERGRALMALISLERLSGNEPTALKLLEKCNTPCKNSATPAEWKALMEWACKLKDSFRSCK